MAQNIPIVVADVELQLSTAIAVGATSFSVSSANDDDGNALPAGKYCFTIDNGKSNKEYLIGQLNGVNVTSVVSVSRQGVESAGASEKHRIGSSCIITDFATIQRVADTLRGVVALNAATPVVYDAEPTLADRKELATVGYVLDTVTGGTVNFDAQTVSATAGEDIVDGDLVYFKTSDQEWYKTDADTASTVEGVQLGIALGTGSDGVAITGGILVNGIYTTTGLTAGSEYYAGNTAGAYSTSAGTTSRKIGIAFSATKLFLYASNPQTITTREKEALSGGDAFGIPSTSNKFVTEARLIAEASFGDGSDGDVTIAIGNTVTLAADKQYSNLTVNGTLVTNGYFVYVKGTLSGTGTIRHSTPTNGGNGNPPGVGSSETGGAGGGSGSSGGIIALYASIVDGSFTIESIGGNGGNGSNGVLNGSSAIGGTAGTQRGSGPLKGTAGAAGGNSSSSGASGTSVNPALVATSGASGGTGGGPYGGAGGGGGGAATIPTISPAELKAFSTKLLAIKSDYTISPIVAVPSGGGGGGGGADTSDGDAGGGGGGAGGNGGHAIIVSGINTWTGTTTLTGGTGGSPGTGVGSQGSPAAGSNGNAGTLLQITYNELL